MPTCEKMFWKRELGSTLVKACLLGVHRILKTCLILVALVSTQRSQTFEANRKLLMLSRPCGLRYGILKLMGRANGPTLITRRSTWLYCCRRESTQRVLES